MSDPSSSDSILPSCSIPNELLLSDQEGNELSISPSNSNCLIESVNDYEFGVKLQTGGFAHIYAAKHRASGKDVAVKKQLWMRDPSVTPTTLSELRMLLLVDHMNVCRLRSVLIGADHEPICLALDMYECDLHNLLRKYKIRFQSKEIKCITKQVADGVQHLHSLKIIHGDLTPLNIMFDQGGIAKIIDFGLSQIDTNGEKSNKNLCTLWYRAPEELFGMLYYTTAVDLWAFGCVISQMYLRQLLFQGGSELDMIFNLIQVMGSPDEQTLPGFENSQFGSFMTLRAETKCNLKSKLKHLKTSEYKLIEALLTYDSNKRKEAFDLLPEYLNHEPAPCNPNELCFVGKVQSLVAEESEDDDESEKDEERVLPNIESSDSTL